MYCLKLHFSHIPGIFLYGLTAVVGLGLLIFKASLSHTGVDYTWLLCMLVDSEFTSSFKLSGDYIYASKVRSLFNLTCYLLASILFLL